MTTELIIRRPDDWHLHLRDGEMLKAVLSFSSRDYARAIIMPNLSPPLTEARAVRAYRERILAALPAGHGFTPLMTLYLSDSTDPGDLVRGVREGLIEAVKLYPAHATTNSAQGVSSMDAVSPVLDAMQREDIPLLVHGEVTGEDVDIFDREARFIERTLYPLTQRYPALRIVLEHVTTCEAVDFVCGNANVGATVTPQHVFMNRNALFRGGLRPHHYCLPVLKREKHRAALVRAITSESNRRFFLGTDSAPHEQGQKESACGCAGAFNSPVALAVYAAVFEKVGALDCLEAFTSLNGPAFYQKPVNTGTITLVREPFVVPDVIDVPGQGRVVPFLAGEVLDWCVRH